MKDSRVEKPLCIFTQAHTLIKAFSLKVLPPARHNGFIVPTKIRCLRSINDTNVNVAQRGGQRSNREDRVARKENAGLEYLFKTCILFTVLTEM